MILVCGDSWALGEYQQGICVHDGLAQLLRESGNKVTKLARPGGSNLDTVAILQSFLDPSNGFVEQVEKIFIFQTEWTRDIPLSLDFDEYRKTSFDYAEIQSKASARFYIKLAELFEYTSIPMFVIGGAGDTLWFDNFDNEHPGVKIACQSFVNLLLNQEHKIDTPIYSYWGNKQWLKDYLRQHLDTNNLDKFIKDLDLAIARRNNFDVLHRQGFFCDDRLHPNNKAFEALFVFLQQNKFI